MVLVPDIDRHPAASDGVPEGRRGVTGCVTAKGKRDSDVIMRDW